MRPSILGSLLLALASSCTKPQAPPAAEAAPAAAQTAPAIDKWEVKVKTSDLDGQRNATVNVVAEEDFPGENGGRRLPMLGISCRPNFFGIGLLTYGPLKSASVNVGTPVAVRIDDQPVKRQPWYVDPKQGVMANPSTRNLVVDLLDAKKLQVTVQPPKSEPVVVTFDVRGLRSHLSAFADCLAEK